MRKILSVVAILLFAANSCTVVDEGLMELMLEIKNQNNELLDELKNLQAKSDSLMNEVKNSAVKQQELLDKVTGLQSELAIVLSQIGNLNDQMSNQNADLDAIKSQLADLQVKYQGILEQLEQLQKLSQILAEIENLKGQLEDLDGKYQVILGSLAQNQVELNALKNQIGLIQSQLDQNLEKISELTSQLGDQGADIENILKQIEELKASCAELKSLLEELLIGKSPVPMNGLVAWWPFNGNANDESGNNLDGNIIGSTELTNDRFGQAKSAYDFDYANASFGKQNDEIYVPYDNILNVDNITISVWVYPRQYYWSGNTGTSYSVVLTRWQFGTSNPSGLAWRMYFNSSSVSCAISDGNTSTIAKDNSPLSLNNWHHIVMTYNSQNVKLYVDGDLKSSTNTTRLINTSGTSGISIGEAAQYNGYWHHVDGVIDDIGIWNRALSLEEVSKIYKGEGF